MRTLGACLVSVLASGCIPDVVPDVVTDLPAECRNHVADAQETDVDCGGTLCPPCFAGKTCKIDADCAGVACTAGLCESVALGVWELASPKSNTNPAARSAHSMVFFADSTKNTEQSLMFGGLGNDNRIWSWDGLGWNWLPSVENPLPRRAAAMAVTDANQVLLYGGLATYAFSDTWVFNGSAWKQLVPASNPSGRVFASAVFDELLGVVRLLGGYDQKTETGPKTLATSEWTFANGTWKKELGTAPPPRWGASLVSASPRCFWFGGTTDGVSGNDELWLRGAGGWEQPSLPARPPPRFGAAMAYSTVRKRVVLFGGVHDGAVRGDTWELDPVKLVWREISTSSSAPALGEAALVYDSTRKRAVLFGGRTDTADSDEVWHYHVRGNVCETDADCETSSCVDGVCCEQESCGQCEVCNAPGAIGSCSPTPEGRADDSCPGVCMAGGECQ